MTLLKLMPHEGVRSYTKLVQLLPVEKFIDRRRTREASFSRKMKPGRTFVVFPLTPPTYPPSSVRIIPRKIKVNPQLVQLHLRDAVMGHFNTREIRRGERARSADRYPAANIAIFNSIHDVELFVTACTVLCNFVPIYGTLSLIVVNK